MPLAKKANASALQLSEAMPDEAIVRLVRRFYELNLADPLLAPFFAGTNQAALRAKFARLVVNGLAGMPMNREALRRTHRHLGIGDIEFAACAKNLLKALGEHRCLDSDSVSSLVSLLLDLESDIVVPTDQLHLPPPPKPRQNRQFWSSSQGTGLLSGPTNSVSVSQSKELNSTASATDSEEEVYMDSLTGQSPAYGESHVRSDTKKTFGLRTMASWLRLV
ncbi:hypothetical protein THASP1DRAFT_29678 [Thamnocephalis sphaerospora]|uniref:Globin n=1 Tax=Thamnocephalis sphaerospora TaxID=78915 RepID=A0A4P9XR24_9FUNG|nr:hypothetical protein THASP1DRAFT_29678 [Thamnocephalis sphaerospora]|eukprot:RKP08523.1 hypothetical protein THASP1DRAFT_29678 [Thamnocephalis sphaerospora]